MASWPAGDVGGGQEFDRTLQQVHARGQSCHGDLGLELGSFGLRLLSIARKYLEPGARLPEILDFLRKLNTDDLYLTTACTQNSETAWHRFTVIYRKFAQELFRYMGMTADAALELTDLTLIDMFLPDRSGHSRIASYDGRSSLVTWLRVIISNRAINERQRMWNRMQRVELGPDIADAGALRSVESELCTERYKNAITESLQSVCLELEPRDRLILLWRYEDGLQLGQIARLLGVHQSTVTRQLERVQKRMRGDVISILSSRYQLSPAAIEECLSVIVESRWHAISVLGLIKEGSDSGSQRPRGRVSGKETKSTASRSTCATKDHD